MTREPGHSGIGVFRGDGHEKPARSLRIEEEILVFGWDARGKDGAFADEGAVVF